MEGKAEKILVLVVDDQPEMRKSVLRILRIEGFATEEAENGKAALEAINAKKPDLVLSDLRMPEMDGIELLHELRKRNSIPFVLMTGFAEILESAEAYKMGVDGFLLKPYQKEGLLAAIRGALDARKVKEGVETSAEPSVEDQYCGIPVGEFISGREVKFPIYLKLSGHKFVRIAYGGEDLSSQKIRELQDKGIRFLYLERQDFRQYVSFASRMTDVIIQSPKFTPDRKAEFLRHSSEMILEFGFQQHLDKEVFDLARMNVEQCLSLLAEEKSLLNLLESLTSHSTPLYSHSMGVALVSCLIGRAMGWESSPLFFRVVTGSILHDIGKKDFPLELQEKISSQMNAEELALWRSHPELGAKLLGEIEGLPAEIVQIVMHHHEVADGSGFPAGITGSKIHPVAKLIAVADEFFKLYRGQPALTPVEAIRVMEKGNRAPGVSGARWENLPALRTAFKL